MGEKIAIWRSNTALGIRTEQGVEAVALESEPVSLDEATRHLPSGGYTTFRTFGAQRVLRLTNHIERLAIAAKLAGQPVPLEVGSIRANLRQVLSHSQAGDVRVRVILDLENQPGTIYYLVEGLRVPPRQDYEQGVQVVTRRLQRTNPLAKLTRFLEKAEAIRQLLPPDTNEAIMVGEDGSLLEGLSSNFFAVSDSTIRTAEEGVLPGITRSLVLEVIHTLAIPLRMEPVKIDDLPRLDEAFITSASRAVLPVTTIDNRPVENGSPGPLTRQILTDYLKRIEAELEVI